MMSLTKLFSLSVVAFLIVLPPAYGQVQLQGKVGTVDNPVSYANVAIEGSSEGTYTDDEGKFLLETTRTGEQKLVISAVGFRTQTLVIDLSNVATTTLNLETIFLIEDALGLQEVVVTGTMKETFVSSSPVKIDVVTSRYLEQTIAPTNLVEGISLVNGVQEVVACGVCFTNSISINGLPGPYTAILMDGTPMYGNLASVYGLNGIPTQIIDRFEVIKGPSSTLYGSEAVAGVINIITKDPARQPLLSVDLMGTSHLESFGNIALAPQLGSWDGYVGLNYAYINDFDDDNQDGFGDNINLDRISLFTKWSHQRKDHKKTTISAKYFYEDRRNGVEAYLQDRAYRNLRGSEEIYGESIYTNRLELFGTYELPTSSYFKLDYSFSHHKQNSYYGADFYQANQTIGFTNFIWNPATENHDVVVGATARYQSYDDNTIATEVAVNGEVENQPDHQFIPGVFAQDEWDVTNRLTVLAGSRLDFYENHGAIFSPRLNAKYKPGEWTTLRANLGTGFRLVNLFTEDHAFVTGQRTVEILEDLQPERSYNAAVNLNHVYTLGNSQGMLDVDVFYTYFTNKIIPDYDTPGKILYANTDGFAVTKGVGVSVNHQFQFPLSFNIGVNFQDVTETEPNAEGINETRFVEFASRWSSVSTATYHWKKPDITFAYTLRMTGPMALPEVFDLDKNGQPLPTARPLKSTMFSLHNLQITKQFSPAFQLYGGVQNLFNYQQEISPLVGFNDPNAIPGFSSYFDTSYAFSPLHGREVYLGFRWNFSR